MDPQKMTQDERRVWLINALKAERREYAGIVVPQEEWRQRDVLRALLNVRESYEPCEGFMAVQDAYLQERAREKGIVRLEDLTPTDGDPDLYLWRGDITTIATDAIVNAANEYMEGCFRPLHGCIDNAIHTFAGIQLRRDCHHFMMEQGHPEPTGLAKITYAYNLPSKYVIHTVGPVVEGRLTQTHRDQLASCYRSCLELASKHDVATIAFCCISTGVFGFPQDAAARVAIDTVRAWKAQTGSDMKVVFNVFKEADYDIYSQLLAE